MASLTSPDAELAERAARWLIDQRRAKFQPLPPELRQDDASFAYAVQLAYQRLLVPRFGRLAGGKIALTTPVMQQLVGYHEPVGGGIFVTTIHHRDARLRFDDFVHPCVECEVAVRLGADLPARDRPYDQASVAEAVAACMIGIELVDDRGVDYKAGGLDAITLIADNALNRGVVLGPAVSEWRRLDLPKATGRMMLGPRLAGEGKGGDVMGGHPFAALAWLADLRARLGDPLRAGDIVMTGSLVATQFPARGEPVEAEIEGLGRATVRFD
ncbi:2-keto-4-pentenoate hydratase [Desertibaculum subflavum]|uniref:2-keto-4-pentenoate hydratase n=1 Tax=Desertibaculum subflavum TaxID=2268458 RepID=UPI000E672D25